MPVLAACGRPCKGASLRVMKAIQIHATGGPEVLQLVELPIPEPGPGQVLIRVEAIGVNFIEIYFRKGVYKATLPLMPGSEAAGTVEELGPRRDGFEEGDPVASVSVLGSYAEYALVPAAQLVKVPSRLSPEQAAAAMLQGMTAHYLAYSTFPLKAGDTALVHAGAGGVGLLLTQMAARLGAQGHHDCFDEREGGAFARGWRDRRDSLHRAGFRGRGQAASPAARAWMWCTTRWARRPLKEPELPASARDAGAVWRVERAGAAVRPDSAERQGIAVCDAADAVALRGDARGTGVARRQDAGLGGKGRTEAAHGAYVSAGRSGAGADRS